MIMRLFLWASVHIRKNRKGNIMNELERLIKRYPQLVGCREAITETYQVLEESFRNGGKLLICGNGGSAADSDHIVGELMKGFKKQRPVPADMREKLGEDLADHLQGALPAISLAGHAALSTAFLNDVAPDMVFAQQVYGYGNENDVLLAITTSGNSGNVLHQVHMEVLLEQEALLSFYGRLSSQSDHSALASYQDKDFLPMSCQEHKIIPEKSLQYHLP